MTHPDEDILARVRDQFPGPLPDRIGVAVSGGSDSTALMHLLHACFAPEGVEILAATVNHALRPESEEEAHQVRDMAESLNISHTILRWRGWDGTGNLQERARAARYDLLTSWADACGIDILTLGHTADDQAETVLMRLARSAGVDGLSAIPPRRVFNGVTLFRPLLGFSRKELRDYLDRRKRTWIEDPSNDNDSFERVRMRKALKLIAPLGLTTQVLGDVAENMSRAREALDWYSFLAAREHAQVIGGNVSLDRRGFRTLPAEIARRLVVGAVTWIGRAEYPPRRGAVQEAIDSVREGRSFTFAGCLLMVHQQKIWICRELAALRDEETAPGRPWDERWMLHGRDAQGLTVRALGEAGLSQCPDWRQAGMPHAALLASPGIWKDTDLIAAPLANWANGWKAELVGGSEEFFASFLSH